MALASGQPLTFQSSANTVQRFEHIVGPLPQGSAAAVCTAHMDTQLLLSILSVLAQIALQRGLALQFPLVLLFLSFL